MKPIKVKTDGKRITFTADKSEDLTKANITKAGHEFAKKEFEQILKKAMKKR